MCPCTLTMMLGHSRTLNQRAFKVTAWDIIVIQLTMATQRRLHIPGSPPASQTRVLLNISTPVLRVSQSTASVPEAVSHPSGTESDVHNLTLLSLSMFFFFNLHLYLINRVWLLMQLMHCEGVAASVYLILLCSKKNSHSTKSPIVLGNFLEDHVNQNVYISVVHWIRSKSLFVKVVQCSYQWCIQMCSSSIDGVFQVFKFLTKMYCFELIGFNKKLKMLLTKIYFSQHPLRS